MKFPLRSAAMAIAVAACLLLNVPAYAHNERVHAGMVDLSYQIMKAVENNYPIQPPANLNPQEFQLWLDYLNAIKAAPAKYRGHNTGLPDPVGPGAPYPCNLPPSWWTVKMGDLKYPVHPYYSRVQGNKIYGSFTGCGTWDGYTAGGIFAAMNDPREGNADYTGTALGFWSANVDAGHDDTHLWFRPSSAGGAGAMKHFVNKGVNIGIAILLAPFICLAEVFAGNPDSCWAHAQDAADTLNPLDEIEGLFPGIGDISGDSSTGMWHHIQVVGGGDNEYDDHQGLLLSSAGPFASMDMIDLGLLVGMDVAGLSIDYEDSRGPKRYESPGGDGLPPTVHRSKAEWQFTTVSHTPFEPVDNLGQWGWNRYFENQDHLVADLGYPLHALGDATVPMHVAGTPAWGHRPFEDAADQIWSRLRLEKETQGNQVYMMRDSLLKGFAYFQMIQNWRATQSDKKQVPVRLLVTTLATHTGNYATSVQALKNWPFDSNLSYLYQFEGDSGKEQSISWYANFPQAVELYYPILTDGTGATIAFLTAASEVLK